MLSEFRYAFRGLRHKPGFALTAVVSIALGIGANAAIFSFADGLLLRPLPVPDASQVVTLRSRTLSGAFLGISWRDYTDFRDKNRSFSGLLAYQPASVAFAADAHAQPQLKGGLLVSANFFSVLGTEPRLGHGFPPEVNQVPGRDAVAVLGHDFWKTEFDADRSVVGRHIRLNGLDFTVIGVAPEAFTGMDQYSRPAFYLPAGMAPALLESSRDLLTDRSARGFTVKGRLNPGVSIAAADAEAAALAMSLDQFNPGTNRAVGAAVRTELQLRGDLSPGTRVLVPLLFGLVAVVLAIACANVANLMLGRSRSRTREIALRLAIGASRIRLVRHLMAESLLIAMGGGVLGLLIAGIFVDIASGSLQIPSDPPIQLSFQLDARVLWLTVAVSFSSAILFGLIPALRSTRTDLVPALKSGEADQARRRWFGRSALVVVQVAGSLVLLVVATQLYRSFSRELAQSIGFRKDHVLLMSFDPSLIRYTPTQTGQFYRSLVERARTVPGVQSVALASAVPMSVNNRRTETVIPEGYQFPGGQESASVAASTVDENYFAVLSVPILRGRGFESADGADSPRVAVVNQAFARHYLGDDPIGKRLRLNRNGPWIAIVGVAVTGKYFTAMDPPTDFLYLPFSQHAEPVMTLMARTVGDPAPLAGPLRDMVRSLDSNLPVFGVHTLSEFFEQRSSKLTNLIAGTVGAIGLLGLALALVGLYAVVAYQVEGRSREIGIRMAVGAERTQVVSMILKQAAVMSGIGTVIGVVLSLAATRALRAGPLLSALDPLLFSLVPLGLLVTTLLAAAIPARRAARIDPIQALRQD